jgi:hypothetical protein
MKTRAEIEAAEQEMFDRRWYDRSRLLAPADPREASDAGSEEHRRLIEEKYGVENLGPYTDHEWGVLYGKHAALRWVLDDEATWDSEWLGDT